MSLVYVWSWAAPKFWRMWFSQWWAALTAAAYFYVNFSPALAFGTWQLAEDSTLPQLNKLDELGAYIVDRLDQEAEANLVSLSHPSGPVCSFNHCGASGARKLKMLTARVLWCSQNVPLTFHFLPVLRTILRLRPCTDPLNINTSLFPLVWLKLSKFFCCHIHNVYN